MRRAVLLTAVLLPTACALPEPQDGEAALQGALASHQASLGSIGAPQAVARAAPSPNPGPTPGPPLDVPPVVPPSVSLGAPLGARPGAGPGSAAPALAGQLVGQMPEAVLHWFGEPRLRRAEGSAEIWHYQTSQCHLDLVLYPEHGVRPGLRVAFASARAIGTARRAETSCLRDLARGANGPGPAGAMAPAQAG